MNPGQDTYYKPINYISLANWRRDRAGTYQDCIDTSFEYVWVRKFPDYANEPVATLGTAVASNSWTINEITLTQGDEVSTVEKTGSGNPYMIQTIDINGVDFTKLLVTARITSGDNARLSMVYRVGTTWYSGPTASAELSGSFNETEFDLSSDSNWTTNRINRVAITFPNFSIGDTIEITTVKLTDDLSENSTFYAESFAAAYKHLNQSLGTNGTYGLKALKSALNTGKGIQEKNEVALTDAVAAYDGL
jgi:hypothetical protein